MSHNTFSITIRLGDSHIITSIMLLVLKNHSRETYNNNISNCFSVRVSSMITTTSFVPENKDDYLEMLVFVAIWQKTRKGKCSKITKKLHTRFLVAKKSPSFFKFLKQLECYLNYPWRLVWLYVFCLVLQQNI